MIVTDKVAMRDPIVRAMTEIQLPCCETPTLVERLETTIHCDRCGIDLDMAPDEIASPAILAA
jgi:hypothetical protein